MFSHCLRYALHRLEKQLQVRWDPFHRLIRDLKLSLLHAGGGSGCFLQAQLHSQYLWSVSYRPFGSGACQVEKQRLLESMLAHETPESCEPFRQNWERIRQELGMASFSGPCDVWGSLSELPTFSNKCTLPKLSRWFSWNQAAEEQMREWTALKTVLAYSFMNQPELNPDEAFQKRQVEAFAKDAAVKDEDDHMTFKQQFGKLKEKLGGGLKLCYHLMSDRLYHMIQVVSITTRPLWTSYVETVKTVKTPHDSVKSLEALSLQWASCNQLQETAALLTSRCHELADLLRLTAFEDTGENVADLTCHILAKRAWSLSRHSAPPDCYAGLLSEERQLKEARVLNCDPDSCEDL